MGDQKTDQELYDYHQQKFNSLEPELRQQMVDYIRDKITPADRAVIRQQIKAKPLLWWAGHHHFFGMSVRNSLRQQGFTDERVGDNLDNYWVAIVEAAVGEDPFDVALKRAFGGELPDVMKEAA
jgi:hypothetical protein